MVKKFYITSIRKNSVSGDRVHVENVVKESDFIHYNIRFLKLYWFLIKKRNEKIILRESVDVLFFCAVVPSYILKYLLKNVIVEINGSIRDEKKINWIIFSQKKLLKFSKKIIFVSIGLKMRFTGLYSNEIDNKSRVVNNGGEFIKPIQNKIKNSEIKLGFVGAKTKWQDIDGVIQWLVVNQDNLQNNIKLHIAGPGFENYENYTGRNLEIIFEGSVSKIKAKAIYQSCNILVCPDKRTYHGYLLSSPIKVYECINMGLLITFFHPWKNTKEFGFAKNQIISWNDALNISIVNDVLMKIRNKNEIRTWKNVVQELNACINND